MINTLKYAKQLEEVGLTREQAETHMQIYTDFMESNLATKQNVADVRSELKQEIQLLRMEMAQMEYRLTIKIGSMISIATAVVLTLSKLIH